MDTRAPTMLNVDTMLDIARTDMVKESTAYRNMHFLYVSWFLLGFCTFNIN